MGNSDSVLSSLLYGQEVDDGMLEPSADVSSSNEASVSPIMGDSDAIVSSLLYGQEVDDRMLEPSADVASNHNAVVEALFLGKEPGDALLLPLPEREKPLPVEYSRLENVKSPKTWDRIEVGCPDRLSR